jgi:hypothetical protein
MVAKQAEKSVCWSAASLIESDLALMYVVLLAVLLAGGIAIYAAYRWYRTLNQETTTPAGEDLAQLAQALQEQGELDAEEMAKIRAAVERGQAESRDAKSATVRAESDPQSQPKAE